MRLGPTEIMLFAAIVVLLFGASRIPKLARSIRQARDELNEEGRTPGSS